MLSTMSSFDRALATNTRTDVCLSCIRVSIDDVIWSHNSSSISVVPGSSFQTTCQSVPKNQRGDDNLDLSHETHHNPMSWRQRVSGSRKHQCSNYDWKLSCIFKSQEIFSFKDCVLFVRLGICETIETQLKAEIAGSKPAQTPFYEPLEQSLAVADHVSR